MFFLFHIFLKLAFTQSASFCDFSGYPGLREGERVSLLGRNQSKTKAGGKSTSPAQGSGNKLTHRGPSWSLRTLTKSPRTELSQPPASQSHLSYTLARKQSISKTIYLKIGLCLISSAEKEQRIYRKERSDSPRNRCWQVWGERAHCGLEKVVAQPFESPS